MGRRPLGTGPRREVGLVEVEARLSHNHSDDDNANKSSLQQPWRECKEEPSGDVYFWNEQTGEVTWEIPATSSCATKPPTKDEAEEIPSATMLEVVADAEASVETSKTPPAADVGDSKYREESSSVETAVASDSSITSAEVSSLDAIIPGAAAAWETISRAFNGNETLKVSTHTRLSDWRDGGLSDDFFARRIVEMAKVTKTARAKLVVRPFSL